MHSHLIDPLFWDGIPECDVQIARLDLQAQIARTVLPAMLRVRRCAGVCISRQGKAMAAFGARTRRTLSPRTVSWWLSAESAHLVGV